MNIIIDKNDSSPAYIQLANQIKNKILTGELSVGDRLPTERELSETANISRGTIKRAYDELSHEGILERKQGSGTFISNGGTEISLSPTKKADKIIDKMVSSLSHMHLSLGEMETLVHSKIQWKRQTTQNIRVAVVDCNMETLSLISGQLYNISDVDVTELLLNDVLRSPQKLTLGYDLILTAKNHYLQILDLAPYLSNIIFKVAIVPSQKVQYQLACLTENMSVGIWCLSQEFASAVYNHTTELSQGTSKIDFQLDNTLSSLSDFVREKDVLILPYDYFTGNKSEEGAVIQNFIKRGGNIILFEYRIDEGSLIHIIHELDLCRQKKTPQSSH